jgi:hypothetical protein
MRTIEIKNLRFRDINEAILLLNVLISFYRPEELPEVIKLIKILKEDSVEQLALLIH